MSTDNSFGPQLHLVFDFTLVFEQSIFALLPTCCFLLVAPLRISSLIRRKARVCSLWLLPVKLLTLLVLWCLPSTPQTRTSLASAALGLPELLAIGALSYTEHFASLGPALLLNGYLLLSTVLGIASARSLWLRADLHTIAAVYTVSLALRLSILVIEEIPKRQIVHAKASPGESTAGVVSKGIFFWLNSLLYRGAGAFLAVDDIGNIEQKFDSSKLLNRLQRVWEQDPKISKWSLLKCTFLAYKWQYLAGVLPRLCYTGFRFAQPYLINTIIKTVGQSGSERSSDVTNSLIGATLLVYVGIAISNACYNHMTYQLLTMYRGGLVSLVFHKTLRLPAASTKDLAAVTLMSTDVEAIVAAGKSIHDVWASVIEIPLATYLLYLQVGAASLLVLIPTFVSSAVGTVVSPGLGPARVKWSRGIQERVATVATMLGQIKTVKMMGLSELFHQKLKSQRAHELRLSLSFRWILVVINSLSWLSEDITPVIVILAAILWAKGGDSVSTAEAFTSLSIVALVVTPLSTVLVSATQIAGATGCFVRLQSFLLLEECDNASTPLEIDLMSAACKAGSYTSSVGSGKMIQMETVGATTITMSDASFKVDNDITVLRNINLEAQPGTLLAIAGRIGSGKSCLLNAIAGELTLTSGSCTDVKGHAAYCHQSPWLQNSSFRDNIIGQSAVDERWLNSVIEACELSKDIAALPLQDQTLVGSGGLSLSGGQKQRLTLARAVYSRHRILLLDDIFSGIDNATTRNIFHRLMGPSGLLRLAGRTVILVTNNTALLQAADSVIVMDGGRTVLDRTSLDRILPDQSDPGENHKLQDGTTAEETVAEQPASDQNKTGPVLDDGTEVVLSRQTGDLDCYKIYLGSIGKAALGMLVFCSITHAVMTKMPQIWLRLWTQHGTETYPATYPGLYVSFSIISIIAGTLNVLYFVVIGVPISANNLHDKLLSAIMNAPLSIFTTIEHGTILNRFSQDMTLIDTVLPMAFLNFFILAMRALVEIGIIASGAAYVGIAIPACLIVLYAIQKYYLRTSRQIRILELETKTPIYTHFTETVAGITTIRAYGWTDNFMKTSLRCLDRSQKPFYMMFCIQRWLQVVLDLFTAGVAVLLVALSLHLPDTTTQGAIGLALVNLMGFSETLTLVIDMWTRLETSLGAVARLKWFFERTPNENKAQESLIPAPSWPARGEVVFNNLMASYSAGNDYVLRDINLRIEPGQRVGLCGRSGSGKSSLILALARMLEIGSGSVLIDGIDIASVPRQIVRSRLVSVPQDALHFSGTIRDNLDPLGQHGDDGALIDVLRKTSLLPAIETSGGLNADMDAVTLSAGQLQLFSLARALLSSQSIVLLDEVTSNVDQHTQDEINRIVGEEMRGRTIIEIAHRLELIQNYDLIVVMADGTVQESGHPRELLSRPDGAFRTLLGNQGVLAQ